MTTSSELVQQTQLPGLTIAAESITVTGPFNPDDLMGLVRTWGSVPKRWRWLIGDAYNAVAATEGPAAANRRFLPLLADDDEEGITKLMLERCVTMSSAVPADRRHPGLSWTHHVAVARLTPGDQVRWLAFAFNDGKVIPTGQLLEAIAEEQASAPLPDLEVGERRAPSWRPKPLPASAVLSILGDNLAAPLTVTGPLGSFTYHADTGVTEAA
jgi:hypothetical protein